MFEQINRLHTVTCELSHAHSLISFLCDYFSKDEPDTNMLAVRYGMYGDLNSVALGIIFAQMKEVEALHDEIFKTWKALKEGMRE